MDKLKPHLKAYQIKWLPSNNEAVVMGWMPQIVVAESEKLARKEALNLLRENQIDSDHFGNEFTYISLNLKRFPECDKFMVGNKVMSRDDIDYEKKKNDRDAEFRQLLSDNPGGWAYIRKGGSYYRPNSCGYTEFKPYAGVYPLKDAVKECIGMSLAEYMRPILIDVTEHNEMMNKHIEELKSRIILKEETT